MNRDDSTFLPSSQETSGQETTTQEPLGKESRLYSAALRSRRISQYFGWPVLVFMAFAPGEGIPRQEMLYYFFLAAPIGFCAILLRLMSQGYDRTKYFVVNGPYRYVRNPVELATLIGYGALGTVLSLPPWYTLGVMVIAAFYMSFLSIAYERDLKRTYGTTFIKYSGRVRRWIPLSLPAMNATMQDYSFHLALMNERSTWLWLVGVILVYAFRQRLSH